MVTRSNSHVLGVADRTLLVYLRWERRPINSMVDIFALRDHRQQVLMRILLDVPTAALQYFLEHKSGHMSASKSPYGLALLAVISPQISIWLIPSPPSGLTQMAPIADTISDPSMCAGHLPTAGSLSVPAGPPHHPQSGSTSTAEGAALKH